MASTIIAVTNQKGGVAMEVVQGPGNNYEALLEQFV